MVIFHSYVKLPEGNPPGFSLIQGWILKNGSKSHSFTGESSICVAEKSSEKSHKMTIILHIKIVS